MLGRILPFTLAALFWFLIALVLRWGARSYPGIYVPESTILNDIFNGPFLFTVIGHYSVLLGLAAHIGALLSSRQSKAFKRFKILALSSLAVAALVSIYGVYWAVSFDKADLSMNCRCS
ncbi:MAG: hypothetical protein K2Y20_03850 [Sphingomonas sp.]|nr:hypothetical protein [Sphingomonas sp.]